MPSVHLQVKGLHWDAVSHGSPGLPPPAAASLPASAAVAGGVHPPCPVQAPGQNVEPPKQVPKVEPSVEHCPVVRPVSGASTGREPSLHAQMIGLQSESCAHPTQTPLFCVAHTAGQTSCGQSEQTLAGVHAAYAVHWPAVHWQLTEGWSVEQSAAEVQPGKISAPDEGVLQASEHALV
jgi:hypothetical protein